MPYIQVALEQNRRSLTLVDWCYLVETIRCGERMFAAMQWLVAGDRGQFDVHSVSRWWNAEMAAAVVDSLTRLVSACRDDHDRDSCIAVLAFLYRSLLVTASEENVGRTATKGSAGATGVPAFACVPCFSVSLHEFRACFPLSSYTAAVPCVTCATRR